MKLVLIALSLLICAALTGGCIQYVPNDVYENERTAVINETPTIPTLTPMETLAPNVTPVPTITLMLTPNPFPSALRLGKTFQYGSEEIRSVATVYRYKVLDSYHWWNDETSGYYIQNASPGNKYLFVFINLENKGKTRVYIPSESVISVYWNGQKQVLDQNRNPDLYIQELENLNKFESGLPVRDWGYKEKGVVEANYLYPGKSNMVDGYLIYEVSKDLKPEETTVAIAFNNYDTGTWVLLK